MPPGRSYPFGPFRLDAAARVLYREERLVALPPKAVDVLIVLVEAGDRPVSKDELLQTAWPGVVVEEGSLASQVSMLRKVLGDGLIQTLPKRGYRFVGQLATGTGASAAVALAAPPDTRQSVRTQQARRSNVPPALTMFVGRQLALVQIREQLHRSRLVTLVGAGGVGKTRLSIEAARQLVADFPDGVCFVELAPLADAAMVAPAIVAALGARAEGDTPPMALIESTLQGQDLLLVLDNCEHVVDEAARVAQALLRALPRLRLLASSRQPLGVEGEALYQVPSLTLPGSAQPPTHSPVDAPADPLADPQAAQDVMASEAGQLFVDRARAVRSGFVLTGRNAAAVAQLCWRLDGIPLAIELAAARLTALSVEEIARRIDDRFRLLTGGLRSALPRQRTLRALVDWSYDLLSAAEREVLDTLSVFAGSFSLDAAEQVCGGEVAEGITRKISVLDAIEMLVAKSLLLAEMRDGSETRYRLLETIRQYAGEKLAGRGQVEAVRQRHFACFLMLAEAGADGLGGLLALQWLARLDTEHDNLRSALDGAAELEPHRHCQLAGALRNFWDTRGLYTEGWSRFERALGLHTARDSIRLQVMIGAGMAAHRLAYVKRADALLGEAIALAHELGHLACEAEATYWLGSVRQVQGPEAFEPLFRRALQLARACGDRVREVLALTDLGRAAMERGQLEEAQVLLHEGVRVGREAGCVIETATALHHAGHCALEQQDFAAAQRMLEEALAEHRRLGNAHDAAQTLGLLGRLALNERRMDDAQALSAEGLSIFRALHDPKCSASTARLHATVLRAQGDGAAALPHAEAAAATYRELGFPLQLSRALCTLGCVHAALGDGQAARRALFGGLVEQQRADLDNHLPELLEAIAGTHAELPGAAQLLGSAAALRERLKLPLLPYERAESERRLADVRAQQRDAQLFESAFMAGRGLTREQAIQAAWALRPAE